MTAGRPPVIDELVIGDEPEAWRAAGFTVDDDGSCRVGLVRLRIDGGGGRLRSWSFADAVSHPALIDGIVTGYDAVPVESGDHANGSMSVDHVVVFSPDPPRTTAALEGIGLDLRRIRPVPIGDRPSEQRFFRAGDAIIELIGPQQPDGDGPAALWGLVTTVADLDATAAHLGPALGPITDAVQPGRRIATVKGRDLGLSVPLAFLTPDPRSFDTGRSPGGSTTPTR